MKTGTKNTEMVDIRRIVPSGLKNAQIISAVCHVGHPCMFSAWKISSLQNNRLGRTSATVTK